MMLNYRKVYLQVGATSLHIVPLADPAGTLCGLLVPIITAGYLPLTEQTPTCLVCRQALAKGTSTTAQYASEILERTQKPWDLHTERCPGCYTPLDLITVKREAEVATYLYRAKEGLHRRIRGPSESEVRAYCTNCGLELPQEVLKALGLVFTPRIEFGGSQQEEQK